MVSIGRLLYQLLPKVTVRTGDFRVKYILVPVAAMSLFYLLAYVVFSFPWMFWIVFTGLLAAEGYTVSQREKRLFRALSSTSPEPSDRALEQYLASLRWKEVEQ